MNGQTEIANTSFDSFDSYLYHQQNNSSTSNTISPQYFISKNEQQSEAAKKVFDDDINLLFASNERYFLGEFQFRNTTIIRQYIPNKEQPYQKIYYTHLKQKYADNLSNQIIIAHGIYETSAHYMDVKQYLQLGNLFISFTKVANSLVDIGYEVHLFDFCGFGHSGGKKMNVSAKDLQSDFISIYERLSHSRPIYVIACSIAVPIVLSCLILNPKTIKINGFISYSAMISIPRIFNQQSITSGGSFYFLSKLFPQLYLNLKVNLSELHRSNFQIKKDILLKDTQTPCISIGMAFELIKIQNLVLDNLQSVNVPLLILYGQEDSIVNQQDSITLYCKVGNLDKTIKILKDQQHLFLLDSNRQQVLDLIYQWIDVQGKHSIKKQEIVNFTQNIPQANHNKQGFSSQIKAESRRKAPAECNSGILSFCSNKSESSIHKFESDDEFDYDQEDEEEDSEFESMNRMYNYKNFDKVLSGKRISLCLSDNSLSNSLNQSIKETKADKQLLPKLLPVKRQIKRVKENTNICPHRNNLFFSNPSSTISFSNPFETNTKNNQKCADCSKNNKKPLEKKAKYVYGTNYSSPIKLQTLIKLFLYAIAILLVKYLQKKMQLIQFQYLIFIEFIKIKQIKQFIQINIFLFKKQYLQVYQQRSDFVLFQLFT